MDDLSRARRLAVDLAKKLDIQISMVPHYERAVYGRRVQDEPSGYYLYFHDGEAGECRQMLPVKGSYMNCATLSYLESWLEWAIVINDAQLVPLGD
jgi:hypothetical protein